jgi:multidrug resistance efflux pump
LAINTQASGPAVGMPLWVIANMKEAQMNDIRIGQPVMFAVDAN